MTEPWKDPVKVAELVAKGIHPRDARKALFKAVRVEPPLPEIRELGAGLRELAATLSHGDTDLYFRTIRSLMDEFYAASEWGRYQAELDEASSWGAA